MNKFQSDKTNFYFLKSKEVYKMNDLQLLPSSSYKNVLFKAKITQVEEKIVLMKQVVSHNFTLSFKKLSVLLTGS